MRYARVWCGRFENVFLNQTTSMPPTLACPEGYIGIEKTTVWGPSLWRMMHCLAWNSDPNDSFAFCELLRKVLPCPHCRASYDHYCETTPLKCFLTSGTVYTMTGAKTRTII